MSELVAVGNAGAAIRKANADGRAALVAYLPAGYPTSRAGSTRSRPWSTAEPMCSRSGCRTATR